jgi:signal recognition particle subunit SEC65
MTAEPLRDNVIDLRASKAHQALDRIAKDQSTLGATHKRTREDWRDYGSELMAQRVEMGSDKQFGAWVSDNGLDQSPANAPGVRSDAMWLAEHWEQVEQFYFTTGCKEDCHHPTRIRTACRKAGFEWTGAKPKKDGTAKAKKGKTKIGWQLAVFHYLDKADFASSTKLHNNKLELEEELGRPIPKFLAVDSPEIAELGEAVRRWATKRGTVADASLEKLNLSESTKAKFDRLVARELNVFRAQFQAEVSREVEKRVAQRESYYVEQLQETKDLQARLEIRLKTLDQWMTEEEFKFVLGCLHPDRHPEDQRDKYDRAFQIFKRLESHLEPDGRVRQSRGWR